MSAWNPSQMKEMCLPCCHVSYQWYVENNELSCQMYQRSSDLFLGLPFNIASTALFTYMIAHIKMKTGDIHVCIGDAIFMMITSNKYWNKFLELLMNFQQLNF